MKIFMNNGFTLIEFIVVIAVIAVLSGVVMFSVKQYINIGKDSNISGNLAVLIPAGEVYYGGNTNSYLGFCDPTADTGSVFKNVLSQMPDQTATTGGPCYTSGSTTSTTNSKGVCCTATTQAWAACARLFADTSHAYCVDSRGMKTSLMPIASCISSIANVRCP